MPNGDPHIASRLRAERLKRSMVVSALAKRFREVAPEHLKKDLPKLPDIERTIRGHESATHAVGPRYRILWSLALGMSEEELFSASGQVACIPLGDHDDAAWRGDIEALELARRAAASDVGAQTLTLLESAVDTLAMAYPRVSPDELLRRVRQHIAYLAQLLDGRKTLDEHRRLLVAGGWLSLLAATCHIDLKQPVAAGARLRTAASFAAETGHSEIAAWCVETEAWQALTDGDYMRAMKLSRQSQDLAPRNSSAYIQATAQEGRAWARMRKLSETHRALKRVAVLAANLAVPESPEHHYRYDPAKADAYHATTLAWVGDRAAEPYARGVLRRMQEPGGGQIRPRRVASAKLDLSLALVAAGQLEEAAQETLEAMTSGVLVPSNLWRAAEVVSAIEQAHVPEARDLRETYRALYIEHRDSFSSP